MTPKIKISDIGFSIADHPAKSRQLAHVLEQMLDEGCTVIELAPVYEVGEHYHSYDDGFLSVAKQFKHRSIHLPAAGSLHEDLKSAKYFGDIIAKIDADTLTFHPTDPVNYAWLDENYGSMLSAENMDCEKDFGQTPENMKEVFAVLPAAGWTFDVNHVITNDPSMQLGEDLMSVLGDRLRRYHLSGFGGGGIKHTLLADTHQTKLLTLMTKDKPVIVESFGEANISNFKKELDYIRDHVMEPRV